MMLLSDIKGQPNAVKYLSRCLSSGRVANSYLFSGSKGIGKALTARAFIMELVCSQDPACGECASCLKIEKGDHPDVIWIKPEKNRLIKIEEVRKIKDLLSLKPYEAARGVCVIEDAHMMRQETSNALLKLLEEPPGDSVMVLMSDKKELLLPTVLSRCSEVRFRSLPVGDTRDILLDQTDISKETAEFLAYFTQGSPGLALELVEEGFEEYRSSIVDMIGRVAEEDNSACLNWENETRDGLLEDIEILIGFFRDVAVSKEGMGRLALDEHIAESSAYAYFSKYSIDKIYHTVEKLIQMKSSIAGNVNPKLAAQILPSVLK